MGGVYSKSEDLRNWHAAAAALHGAQAALTALLLGLSPSGKRFRLTRADAQKELSKYNMDPLIPTFPALSMTNHIVCAASTKYRDYVSDNRQNPLRWAEYSVSSGIMLWIIAQLTNITDRNTLATLMVYNACMMYIGALLEKKFAESSEPLKNPEVIGLLGVSWAIFGNVWSLIFNRFDYEIRSIDAPKIVYAIVIALFVFFLTFGGLHLLAGLKIGVFADFDTVEKGYIILSMTSKTLLTWMVYGGVLRSSAMDEDEEEVAPVGVVGL